MSRGRLAALLWLALAAPLWLAFAPPVTAQTVVNEPRPAPEVPAGPMPPVILRAEVDRTAIWVGDPVTFTVEITCPPGTDILAEDLARDRLRLQGLDLSDAQISQQTRADGTVVHRARYHLTSYSTDTASLQIEPLTVRYYVRHPGERLDSITPQGEVVSSAIDIALRSTLPDSDPPGLRDRREPLRLPSSVGFIHPLGVVAVALSIAPVLVALGLALARRQRARAEPRSTRKDPMRHRESLEAIRRLGGTGSGPVDVDARRRAFDRLDGLLREYLTDLDIPAASLTVDEVRARLDSNGHDPSSEAVAAVLGDCQRARYGGPAQLPDGSTLTRALDQMDDLLERRTR